MSIIIYQNNMTNNIIAFIKKIKRDLNTHMIVCHDNAKLPLTNYDTIIHINKIYNVSSNKKTKHILILNDDEYTKTSSFLKSKKHLFRILCTYKNDFYDYLPPYLTTKKSSTIDGLCVACIDDSFDEYIDDFIVFFNKLQMHYKLIIYTKKHFESQHITIINNNDYEEHIKNCEYSFCLTNDKYFLLLSISYNKKIIYRTENNRPLLNNNYTLLNNDHVSSNNDFLLTNYENKCEYLPNGIYAMLVHNNSMFYSSIVNLDKPIMPVVISKKYILLIIDTWGWAFDNITKNIIKYSDNKYNIVITTYPEMMRRIYGFQDDEKDYIRENHDYCKINFHEIEHVVFFWYGCVNILEYLKTNYNIKSYHLAIYDYSKWINNDNDDEKDMHYNNMKIFCNTINSYLYSCPKINQLITQHFNIPGHKAYDGVDEILFNYIGYDNTEKDINKNEDKNKLVIGWDKNEDKDKLVIGWVGNSDKTRHGINKGYDLIVEILNKVKDKYIFLPQDANVSKISHNDVPKYIKNIDIMLCFSNYEGTPNPILEASSCGKCWISTNVGIVEKLNKNKHKPCGIIIERTEQSLISALNILYENRNLLTEYGNNGRENILKHWTWKKRVKQYYDFFDIILQ